jgi:hypothetical protein
MARAPKFGPTISRGARYRIRMRVNTDPVILEVADAMVDVGEQLLADVHPHVPDAAPYGQGLVTRGGVAGFALGKRIDHNTDVATPRRFKPDRQGADVAVGFSFPARFQETGTSRQSPHPFLGPAGLRMGPSLVRTVRERFPRVNL